MTPFVPTSVARSRRVAACLFATAWMVAAGGCAGYFSHLFADDGAEIHLAGLGEDPASLDAVLPYAAYDSTPSEYSIYASDVPLGDLIAGTVRNGQFLHAQLLWTPKPGRTPVDETATNLVLRYVVVSDGNVGVYGGGGFAWPRGEQGKGPISLVIDGSSLSLLANSEGFTDPLTPASLTGTIWVPLDSAETLRFRRGISQLVTDALGVSRWVDAADEPLTPDQVLALLRPADRASGS